MDPKLTTAVGDPAAAMSRPQVPDSREDGLTKRASPSGDASNKTTSGDRGSHNVS